MSHRDFLVWDSRQLEVRPITSWAGACTRRDMTWPPARESPSLDLELSSAPHSWAE